MAGVPGFEPGNAGIKTQCLTAWRYPNEATNYPYLRDNCQEYFKNNGGGVRWLENVAQKVGKVQTKKRENRLRSHILRGNALLLLFQLKQCIYG